MLKNFRKQKLVFFCEINKLICLLLRYCELTWIYLAIRRAQTKGTWLARISNPVQVALLLGSDKSAVTVNSVI